MVERVSVIELAVSHLCFVISHRLPSNFTFCTPEFTGDVRCNFRGDWYSCFWVNRYSLFYLFSCLPVGIIDSAFQNGIPRGSRGHLQTWVLSQVVPLSCSAILGHVVHSSPSLYFSHCSSYCSQCSFPISNALIRNAVLVVVKKTPNF